MAQLNARKARAGFTLLEMVITLALTTTTIGSLIVLAKANTRLCETGVSHSSVEANARRAMEHLAREFASARSDSIDALPASPLWVDQIDFDQVDDVRAEDGRITWSPTRIELRLAPGELDNAADDDGDELVDERELVLVHDAGTATELVTVLARNVREYLEGEVANGLDDNQNGLIDEPGAAFERAGDDLRMNLTIETNDREGRRITRTLTTTMWSRN